VLAWQTYEVIIDGNPVQIEAGSSILQACESVGINIPRFCFHERLSVAGNCRMCLVEIEKSPKPVASCAFPTMPNMKIFTNSAMVKKAREGVMEFMLANHPLDCPICDQGGECDLQDQSMLFGSDRSRFAEAKRGTQDKNLGPLVKTVMTRCIHCTRCVRFSQEVAGVPMLGAVGRGNAMEIGTYVEKALATEMSGNVIDLCPVGALTNKPYAFTARSWELRSTPSVDVLDGCGAHIKVDTRVGEVMRVQPRLNEAINEEWISDKKRFAVDGLKRQRLDVPMLRVNGQLQPVGWGDALKAAAAQLGGASGAEIGAFAGPLVEVEALLCLKELLNSLGSTATVSTAAGAQSADLRPSYLLNATIAGLEDADAVLAIGCNPRVEAPLVNTRLRRQAIHNLLPVGVVGPEMDLTYDHEHLGTSIDALQAIADGSSPFAATLKGASKPALLIGQGALNGANAGTVNALARKIAADVGVVAEGWNGFCVLQHTASAAGALDIGFVPGPTAAPLAKLKVVYLLGADDVGAAADDAFVIYQGHHGDAGASAADLVLPGAAYTEKSATYVNTEGRVQRTARAVDPPGDAREDWSVLVAISQAVGKPLPYTSLPSLRARMADVAPHLADDSGVSVPAASAELTSAALGFAPAGGAPSKAPMTSIVTNFYMTDSVSRASKTMAKCVETFGTRV